MFSIPDYFSSIFLFVQLTEAGWEPDYGPSKFVPSWGATVTGARDYLVAYNVNLLGTKQQAHRIALNIREAGRGPKEVIICVVFVVYMYVHVYLLYNYVCVCVCVLYTCMYMCICIFV